MPLSSKDYKALLEIIELCYSIPDRKLIFQALCERLQRLVPISTAAFIPIDPQTRGPALKNSSTFNIPDDKLIRLFCLNYAPLHPNVKAGFLLIPNNVGNITDIISPSKLAETEYSKDFQSLIPCFYEMGVTLSSQGDPTGMLGFHRPRQDKDFTGREKEIMGILAPHLSRAIHNLNLIETITSSQGIGLIVIGQDGIPPFINDEAKRALNGRHISSIPDPGYSIEPIFFKSETGVYRVRTMVQDHGSKGKTILLEPIPAEHDHTSRLINLGLTKREQEIVMLVTRGLSNREIAERLFICEQTVKDHLRRIFEKMKIRSRCELMAKLIDLNSFVQP